MGDGHAFLRLLILRLINDWSGELAAGTVALRGAGVSPACFGLLARFNLKTAIAD